MISRSSSFSSMSSSSYFLEEDPVSSTSYMSDDDEYRKDRTPPPRSANRKRKVINNSRSCLSLEKKNKGNKNEESDLENKQEEDKKEDSAKDEAQAYFEKHGYYRSPLDFPDELIATWIEAEPGEYPTKEQMRAGCFDKARQYLKEVYESLGFNIKTFPPGYSGIADVMPASCYFDDYDQRQSAIKELAVLSLEKNNLGTDYVVTHLEQVNIAPSYYNKYFITFHAKHVKTCAVETFRARVMESPDGYVIKLFDSGVGNMMTS